MTPGSTVAVSAKYLAVGFCDDVAGGIAGGSSSFMVHPLWA
jgi:hypothetical protein